MRLENSKASETRFEIRCINFNKSGTVWKIVEYIETRK